mmetsp:Transcript_9782/g.36496  ORF Transcript_9782/g.36496 Transcript_9782/m.36496 type:complete len:366 (-) Transcript_9782:1378-2475(-)
MTKRKNATKSKPSKLSSNISQQSQQSKPSLTSFNDSNVLKFTPRKKSTIAPLLLKIRISDQKYIAQLKSDLSKLPQTHSDAFSEISGIFASYDEQRRRESSLVDDGCGSQARRVKLEKGQSEPEVTVDGSLRKRNIARKDSDEHIEEVIAKTRGGKESQRSTAHIKNKLATTEGNQTKWTENPAIELTVDQIKLLVSQSEHANCSSQSEFSQGNSPMWKILLESELILPTPQKLTNTNKNHITAGEYQRITREFQTRDHVSPFSSIGGNFTIGGDLIATVLTLAVAFGFVANYYLGWDMSMTYAAAGVGAILGLIMDGILLVIRGERDERHARKREQMKGKALSRVMGGVPKGQVYQGGKSKKDQ